jgi:WD40 repeat protein
VTASNDNTARIWDADTGNQVFVLTGHRGPISDIAFSADGRRIVTASDDGTARIWAVIPSQSELWQFAGQLKHRDLTAAEWQEFYLNQ